MCHEQYVMRKQSALTSDRHPRIDINASNEHEAVGFLGAKPDPFVVVVFFIFYTEPSKGTDRLSQKQETFQNLQ